jgi:hypothetical protein
MVVAGMIYAMMPEPTASKVLHALAHPGTRSARR